MSILVDACRAHFGSDCCKHSAGGCFHSNISVLQRLRPAAKAATTTAAGVHKNAEFGIKDQIETHRAAAAESAAAAAVAVGSTIADASACFARNSCDPMQCKLDGNSDYNIVSVLV